MSLLERYQVLRVDSQTIKAKNITQNLHTVQFSDDENMTGSFLQLAGRPTGRFSEVNFITELKGLHPTQTKGDANIHAKLFKAAGLAETLTPGSVAAYATGNTPNTTKVPISLLELYRGAAQSTSGMKSTMTNVVFNMIFRFVANQIAELEFQGRGQFDHNPVADTVPALSEAAGNPLRCLNATATFAGVTLSVREFEFNLGNEIVLPENGLEKYGYDVPEIVNRAGASVRLLYKEEVPGTFDPWEIMQVSGHPQQDVTNVSVSLSIGNYAKNICSVTANFNITAAPELVPQDGIYYYQLQGKPDLNAFSLTFT